MAEFSGQVKRNKNKRKFNSKDKQYCGTGGIENGCPFFRLNNARIWVCTLFRLIPKLVGKQYERVSTCLNDDEPPTKKSFLIHYTTAHTHKIIATSEEEAKKIFMKEFDGTIKEIVEGEIIDYENLI